MMAFHRCFRSVGHRKVVVALIVVVVARIQAVGTADRAVVALAGHHCSNLATLHHIEDRPGCYCNCSLLPFWMAGA